MIVNGRHISVNGELQREKVIITDMCGYLYHKVNRNGFAIPESEVTHWLCTSCHLVMHIPVNEMDDLPTASIEALRDIGPLTHVDAYYDAPFKEDGTVKSDLLAEMYDRLPASDWPASTDDFSWRQCDMCKSTKGGEKHPYMD